jgi:beta-mannanase
VPSCGRWWGVAPLQFHWSTPLDKAVAFEENVANRPMDIVHVYHVNGQLFPTSTEINVATQSGHNRLLLINWKPATDMTWAQVAAGGADQRIDAEAAYLKAHFPYPFFLAIYHEPEDNVNPTSGSGMTATDYAAMYRHVVQRLRADGVHNAITVMDYMGFNKWAGQSWFPQLWPGDDVVDWIGLDPYGTANPNDTWTAHDLNVLVDRQDKYLSGYYHWATTAHPGKPIMLCEWGVQYASNNPTGQADFFNSMDQEVAHYPALKALVYYDVPQPPAGSSIPQTTVTLNATAEAAFQAVANSTPFVAPRWHY